MRQRGSSSKPARKHEAHLRPAEPPRDRTDAGDPLPRARPVGGTRAEMCFGQLVDRSSRAKQTEHSLIIVYELAIDGETARREVGHHRAELAQLIRGGSPGPLVELLQQHAGERDLERALRNWQQAKLL